MAAWYSGHTCLQESTSSNISYVENERKPLSRGDQGEVTGPGHGERGFSPVCAPPPGLGHRGRKDPGLPGGVPVRAGWKSRNQAGHAERSSGPHAGFLGPVHSAQVWPGPGAGEGSPFPHQSFLYPCPRFLGLEEEDLDGIQVFCFLLKFPSKMLEATEGRPTGRGVDGRVEGRGKHHWPSESGIETDGRGEQYYHSKDPMGAIQQIPY